MLLWYEIPTWRREKRRALLLLTSNRTWWLDQYGVARNTPLFFFYKYDKFYPVNILCYVVESEVFFLLFQISEVGFSFDKLLK